MEHIRKKWIVLDNYAYKPNSFCFIREMKEEFDIQNPRLCGIKQIPIENGRHIVFLFHTDENLGEVASSDEGEMVWVKSQNCQR